MPMRQRGSMPYDFPNGITLREMHFCLIARAGTTGSLMPQKKGLVGVPRTARTPEAEEMVLDAFLQEPTTSIRTISRLYGVFESLVQRVLKENHQHPYHYTQVQHLQPQDYPARVEFCQWLLRQHALTTQTF
jgi:hypothetical protein